MSGYMTKLQGYIYEGELVNGASAPVENGLLMVAGTSTNKGKLVLPAADTISQFLLKEKTTIYDGIVAYRFVAKKLAETYYFVENAIETDSSAVYDGTAYTTAVGKRLRAHPVLQGEEFVTTKITGSLSEGTLYGVKNDGTIG